MPYLSKVPILGALFRDRAKTRRKTNLVVFLRPTVLRDATPPALPLTPSPAPTPLHERPDAP